MLLRKVRCFRLGRNLVWGWRWILHGRSRRYRRLQHDRSPLLAPARRLITWVRSLSRKICMASISKSDDETSKSLLLEGEERPPPKGHLAVYVGEGKKMNEPPQRFFVPVLYFNHPLFVELLREAEEEFGFQHLRGITIPCPVWRFERIQTRIGAGYAVAGRKNGRRTFCYWHR